MFGSWILFKVVFVVFNRKQRLTFFVTKFGFDYFFRVSLGERLQHDERSGVIKSTGSTLGEKEITFQVKKVRKVSICHSHLSFTFGWRGGLQGRALTFAKVRFNIRRGREI